jgi:cytochrome b6-f complex iron-sulfur subunit
MPGEEHIKDESASKAENQNKGMKRRSFLGVIFAVVGSISFVSLAYPFLKYLAPPKAVIKVKKLEILKSDIGNAKEILFQNTPAIIIDRPGKGLIALSRVCTHLGCLIDYDEQTKTLVCPCHAGIYNLEGRVISGPPPESLTVFPLKVEGENIIIG